MNAPDSFANILERHGRRLDDVGSVAAALTRRYALLAIDSLSKTEAAILGGDVWDVVDGKPQPAYDNWHSDPRRDESTDKYRARSLREAREYVSSYPDPEDGTILYTLVVNYMPGDQPIL